MSNVRIELMTLGSVQLVRIRVKSPATAAADQTLSLTIGEALALRDLIDGVLTDQRKEFRVVSIETHLNTRSEQ